MTLQELKQEQARLMKIWDSLLSKHDKQSKEKKEKLLVALNNINKSIKLVEGGQA